jgi:hypothetical protein
MQRKTVQIRKKIFFVTESVKHICRGSLPFDRARRYFPLHSWKSNTLCMYWIKKTRK